MYMLTKAGTWSSIDEEATGAGARSRRRPSGVTSSGATAT
jgi:hypothetical protein